jgi:hypothetical protein
MGMFCKKCGTEMKDGAKFCPSCGVASGDSGFAGGAVKQKGGKKKIFKVIKIVCLVVVIVLAGLVGFMSLATKSATDHALTTWFLENDLRHLRSAGLLYYGDYNSWPDAGDPVRGELSDKLEQYSDGFNAQYLGGIYITPQINMDGSERQFIGFSLEKGIKINRGYRDLKLLGYKVGDSLDKNVKGIKKNLASRAKNNGYYQVSGAEVAPYRNGPVVYVVMH